MKRYFTILGIILLIGAVLWRLIMTTQFQQRFPNNYVWTMNSLGLTSYADSQTGQFPAGTTLADDPINITIRNVSIDNNGATNGNVLISDHFQTRNASTNVTEWEYTTTAIVNPQTGQIVEGDHTGDYYFLPRNPDPKVTYSVSNSSYQSLPMSFQAEEDIAGIITYKYSYRGDLPNASAYADLKLEEGQAVFCFDFEMDYWVEPTTGEIIKYREWCEGDWVVNQTTGERLYALQRWGTETTGDDLTRQITQVSNQLNQYRLNTLYIPFILGIVGIFLLVWALFPIRSSANLEVAA